MGESPSGRSDLVVQGLQSANFDGLGCRLRLEHHFFASEGVDAFASLGGGLLLHGELHAHEFDVGALLEVSNGERFQSLKDRVDFFAGHTSGINNAVGDLALGANGR